MSILELLATEHRLPPEAPGRPLVVPTAVPDVQPGQLWLIELSPDGICCPALRSVIDRANVVIYDRAVAGIVAESLRLGLYAEPAPGANETDSASGRAVGLARDGWAVVRLVSARPTQRERIVRVRRLIDELAVAKAPSELTVTVLAELSDGVCEPTETWLARLDQVVVTYPRDARLTIVVDGINRHAAARGDAVAGNGLAG